MNNIVIKCENPSQGEKIMKYWKDLGVDTGNYPCSITAEGGGMCIYYGILNGRYSNYSLETVLNHGAEIIQLPELSTFPRMMLVSDSNEGSCEWKKEMVVAYVPSFAFSYITYSGNPDLTDDMSTMMKTYKFAKEIQKIEEPKIVELTLQDISDKTGIPVELIRIKK